MLPEAMRKHLMLSDRSIRRVEPDELIYDEKSVCYCESFLLLTSHNIRPQAMLSFGGIFGLTFHSCLLVKLRHCLTVHKQARRPKGMSILWSRQRSQIRALNMKREVLASPW